MAIEIVDFPIENGGSFHSYVKLPEGSDIPVINPMLHRVTCVNLAIIWGPHFVMAIDKPLTILIMSSVSCSYLSYNLYSP